MTDLGTAPEQLATIYGKTVLIAALNARYERKPFSNFAMLLWLDVIRSFIFLPSGRYSLVFSLRNSTSKEDELIGGTESYKALCCQCYLAENTKKYTAEKQCISIGNTRKHPPTIVNHE